MVQSPRRSCRLLGLDPSPLDLIQLEDDTRIDQQPLPIDEVALFVFDRESTNQSGIEIRSEDGGVSTPVRIQSRFHSPESFSPNLVAPAYSTFSFEPHTLVSLEALIVEVDLLTVSEEPIRTPYHFHYNQPITKTYGPVIVQLPAPCTSPCQDNPWYQEILRDAQSQCPTNISRDASSSYYSSPTAMSAFGADINPAYDDHPSASGNFVEI